MSMEGIQAIDTHKMVEELRAAGFNKKQAEAQVSSLMRLIEFNLATKTDISEVKRDIENLRKETKTDISEVKRDIENLRKETKADIAEVRREIEQLRKETKTDIEMLRKDTRIFILAAQFGTVAILGALMGFLKFFV